jgi:hypothetical protein
MKSTIFEEATGFPLLPADEANERVIDLSQRIAALERALKGATNLCFLKKAGFCYASCPALVSCAREGLSLIVSGGLPGNHCGGTGD